MRIEFYGLTLETSAVTFYLWSPWRCTALEHKLFEVVRGLPQTQAEDEPDQRRVTVRDAKVFRSAIEALDRVMKGWQEEAEMGGGERRFWRWLLEGDTDSYGYDHAGEKLSLWGFLRVGIEQGGPGDAEKGEDIDLEGFGFRIWGEKT